MSANKDWKKQEAAEFWKPKEEGDSIEGVLVGFNDTDKGRVYRLRTADGKVVPLPSHAYLISKLEGVRIGQEVRIVHTEKKPAKSGQSAAYDYDVFSR